MAAGRIIIPNVMPALDINGNPVAGAKLTFYANETTTLQAVYTSAALTVAHPNPITADSAGAFASIFADTDVAYSVAITDADNAPIVGLRNRDNVKASLFFGDDATTRADLTLSNLSNTATARTNLGVAIGTNVQAYDADLTTWAGITPGTGVATALAVNVGSAGAFTTFNGAGGTPSSVTLTNATGLPVAGITASTSTALGVGSLELGHASDTTLARSSAGNVSVEGNLIYRAGGTDVPITDGGTGSSTAADARTALAVVGTADLAASTGAALVGSITSGTGATARTVQAKFRDVISVKDFGAVGDGVTDDSAAFNAALTASVGGLAGRGVYVPGSNARYVIGSTIVVPGGARLYGDGARSSSFLIKAFNGTFITLADGAQLSGLRMNGNGATYTGKGIEHIGGNQQVTDTFIYDTQDTTVYFSVTSGANCHYENVTAYMYGSTSGSGKWAFKVEDSASAPAGTPRHFVNIKTGGFESFYFGASNNTLVSASALYDLGWPVYSAGVKEYSRNVEIVGCRIGSTAQLDIYGSGTIIGCDIGSKVSLKPTSVYCLGPNLYNNGWEDVSGSGDNLVYSINDIDYTPVCYAGGVAITLGNGTLVGRYSREGRTIRAMIRLIPGSTTSFGAGQLSFDLPQATTFAYNQVDCHGRFEATSGTMYRINGRIAASGSVVLLERDTTGSVTATAPGTMAATGAITMTVVYDV